MTLLIFPEKKDQNIVEPIAPCKSTNYQLVSCCSYFKEEHDN